MKKIAKIFTFLILIFCGVVFASCGKGGTMPSLSASETNFEIVIGTDESKTFDVTLSDYGNGSDSVRVESYEQNKIIDFTTEKIRDGLTRVTVKPLYPGKATIKISSITHNAKPIEVTVNVVLPVGDIEIDKTIENKLYVIKGESVDFGSLDLINYIAISTGIEGLEGVKTNQIGVTYTLENVLVNDGVSIENGKLSVSSDCALSEVEIRATSIYNAEITKTFKVKILNPISSAMYIDGNKVFENGILADGSDNSYAFELYPRETDVTMSQKDVLIYVKAGVEADSVKIEKLFDDTKYAVELKNLTYENGMFKYTYTISALNAGYLENISFKISYKDYTLGENGKDYSVSSGNLSVASYNLPNSVLVNGNSSTSSGLDVLVFENIATIGKGTLLEFTLSPSNLAPEYGTIRLWAENYNNCPVSFYKLNSTRTSYELVFGYPRDAKDGDSFVCSGIDHNGNAYFDMPVGTKLYVVKNQKFDKTNNANAVVYASSLNFYDLGSERSKIQLNIKVNPGASSVNRVNYDGTDFTIINSNLIISELVENFEIYLAIAPENFDLGTSSIVKLKNSSLADVSNLTVVSSDENYLYVKFTLSPKKLGSTKLTIYLCDGFEKEFDLKIISTLDDISIDVSEETESIVDYKENLTGNLGEDTYTVQKLAFRSGTSIQLTKTAYPISAEYIVEYSFYDLDVVKSISQLSINDIFENATFGLTSDILNVDTLKNYSIIQAKTSQSAGKTLIKIDVKGRNADGEGYEEESSHTFYFLVEIYKGVDGFEISSNVHEIYSYETLGDRNAEKSKCEFSVTLQSRFGLPTYLNALELYYGTELVEFNDANRAVLQYNDKDIVVITRNLEGNVWTYSVQAFTSDVQNLVFVLKLIEANENKVIGGVVRVVVKDAIEIEDIEIVNVDLNDGIYIENNNVEGDESEATFEIKYNLYTKDGSEPLNTGLEFELSSNLIALGVKIDANGKITVPAGVGGNGKVLIYPSSNYFASSSGMKEGSNPFVEINISIANGESEETAIRIDSQDKINYLKKAPTKHYLLTGNFAVSETMNVEFTGGIYGFHNGKNSTLNVTATLFAKFAGIIKNVDFIGKINANLDNLGIIAYENYGNIENVNVSDFEITNKKENAFVGVLVGKNYGTITGGEIVASLSGFNVGGVAGVNGKIETEDEKTYKGTISNMLFAGNILASGNAGGIAAENSGEITNCKIEKWSDNTSAFISAKTGANGYFGAIAGVSYGEISQTYAYSYNDKLYDITATENVTVGGLVGRIGGGKVSECMTNFSLDGEKVGGLAGDIENDGQVEHSYTLSKVSNSSAKALAISGINKILNSYSKAYYIESGSNQYLNQIDGKNENVYCAGGYDSLTNFNLALQNNLWGKHTNIWGYSSEINNGSTYLLNAQAPSMIDKINVNISEADSSKYMFSQKGDTINIVLYYYQILESLSDGVAKSQLNNLNILSLEEIFGENNNLLFKIESSSSISFVGNELRISGVGKTEVKVTSKYASTTCKEQTIVFYVIYPIQDFNLYHGSSSMNPSTIIKNGDIDQVGYSKTETYASNVRATVLLNGTNYSIFTNLFAIGFNIDASKDANGILNGVGSIYQKGESEDSFDKDYKFISEGTYTLSPSNYQFESGESEKFSINAILTLQNDGIGTYLGNISDKADFNTINELISKNFHRNYEIQVVRGASRIQTTLTDSELSPSNVLNFDVVAISDKNNENIIVEIYENDILVGSTLTNVENAIFDITAVKATKVGNNHNFNVYVSVKSDIRKTISKLREFKIKISDEDRKVTSTLNLTLIPQEVVSISQSHYAAEVSSSNGFSINSNPTTVLRPGKSGLLAINLYPDYAAYSKIEIESAVINSEYYVLFEQMINSENNNYINASGTIGYSSERDTNKLTIYHSEQLAKDNGMIYVRTKIVDAVEEGIYFPITIKVYPADSTKEVKTATIVLASETINKAQITVDGKKDAVISRGNYIDFEVTVNEDEELRDIRVQNYEKSNLGGDDISIIYNTAEYEIKDGKKIYKGRIRAGLNAEIYGDGKVDIQTIMRKTINGKEEKEYDSITLSIVDFTVDGMYIEGNAEDDNVFVAPIQLRQDLTFCFKLSSTPAYNSASEKEKEAANRIAQNKNFFLKNIALNINYQSKYNDTDYNYLYTFNKDKLTFSNETIEKSEKGYTFDISSTEKNANLAYNLYYKNSNTGYYDENGVKNTNNYFDVIIDRNESDKPLSSRTFSINGLRSGNIPMQIKIAYTLPSDHNAVKYFTYDFIIKVQVYEDEDTPIAIKTEEEFVRYMNSTTTESGSPANYILMNDLYLTDFTPIANTDMIASLDGNNKIITIKNFNISSMLNNNSNQTLNLALFQNVGENTTLKNLTINLYELEDIIIDEDLVSNVNVAGLFIENYGIIYNCEVTALNLAKAYNSDVLASADISIADQDINKAYRFASHSDGNGIRVYFNAENHGKLKKDSTTVQIAGLGIRNYAAGRITNSRVGNTTFTKVFMTNIAANQSKDYSFAAEHLTLLGQADIAGVVLRNEGVIASSFFSNGYITNLAVSGTASKTAGFAIYNDYGGIITGSYVKSFKKVTEINSKYYTDGGIYAEGISAGFIYENSSVISDCYANLLLGGSLSGRLVSGFVYSNTTTGEIERCYSAATITGKLTTRMPFSGNNAKGDSMQLGNLENCYYYVQNYDTETLLEEKYSTGAYAILASTVDSDLLYGYAYTSDSKELVGSSVDGVWRYINGEITLTSANEVAISVRYLIENYNGEEGSRRFPYVNGYEYGSSKNPIIIRTADEFNRAFGQETGLKENAYYAISQKYNKNDGTVFGNYRLISHIDFNNLENIAATKVASSLMTLTGKSTAQGGIFDGNGLTISNIEIALSEHTSVGLFSQIVSGAVFKNVNLTVKQVSAGNGVTVGGVAGHVYSSSLINIDLQATNLKGENRSEINGVNVIGGIVGVVQGESKLSNLSSSISVISNYRGNSEYLRSQIEFSNLSYAGGIAGIIDIFTSAGESSVSVSTAQVNKLSVSGESIIIEAFYVGGAIGYVGESTKVSDVRFEISGKSNFEQKINSTGSVAGGIVGVNKGDLSEIRIEHEDDVQNEIEDSIAGYNKNGSSRYGNTSLFGDVITTNDVEVEYVGGLVGQMVSGNLINSYAKVDVSLSSAKYAGGLIGYNKSNGKFDQVYALGDVDGKLAGGLIGLNEGSTSITHAVAINFYSKENSGLSEALDAVSTSNSYDLAKAGKAIPDDNKLILSATFGDLNATYTFTKSKNDNAFSISEVQAFSNESIYLIKINNQYFIHCDNEFQEWINSSNANYEKSFSQGGNNLYLKDGRVYKTYDESSKKLSNEITNFVPTYYLETVKFSKENEIILEAKDAQIDVYGNIVELNVKNIGYFVGEEKVALRIGSEVFANKSFTFNNVKLLLNNDIDKVEKIIKNLDDYGGVAADGALLNRMFLAANDAWDANMWAKDPDDMLPYLIFGVVSKVLYIEKPKDFERLWKYSNEGYVVIIGDDPATAFNPYKYDSTDSSTYGEFTSEDLAGLSRDGENNFYFNLSGIQETFVPSDFKGTLYGEREGWNYFINGLTEKTLFSNVIGGVIRNIGFGYAGEDQQNSNVHSSTLLANGISSNALIENITVKYISLNVKTSGGNVGALANSIDGVTNLEDIHFNNVILTIENENNNENNDEKATVNAGMLAGSINNVDIIENVNFANGEIRIQGYPYNQVQVGYLAGYLTGGSLITKENVIVEESEIKIESDVVNDAYIGGYFGNSEAATTINDTTKACDAIKNVTIDFSGVATGKVYAGLMFGSGQNITTKLSLTLTGEINGSTHVIAYVGGLAGSGNGTIENITVNAKDTNLINVNVKSVSGSQASSVGGLIGYTSEGETTIKGENRITGNILADNSTTDSGFIAVGGVVGSIGATLNISGNLTTGTANNHNEIIVTSDKNGNYNDNYTGGVVGYIKQNAATIVGTVHIYTNISVSGKNLSTGGIVGHVDVQNENQKAGEGLIVSIGNSNGDAKDFTFNGDINATITATADKVNLGGIVGYIVGVNSNGTNEVKDGNQTIKSNISQIYNASFKDGAIYVNKNNEEEITISDFNVGGLVGFMSHTFLTGGYVSGSVQIDLGNKDVTITTARIGGVVGSVNGGTNTKDNNKAGYVGVISTKSWGNIKLEDSMNIESLYIGGVVGNTATGTYWRFGGNKTLTSIYNTNLGTENKAENIRALVGSAPAVSSSSGVTDISTGKESDTKLNNSYSHMFNLSVDATDFGSNDLKFEDYINDNKDPFGNNLVDGSKLKPESIGAQTEFGSNDVFDIKNMKYYIAKSDILIKNVNIYANAHLIGNTKMWKVSAEGKNGSPIDTNNGYVTGFMFYLNSEYVLPSNGTLSNDAPNGIANINYGIIFANSVQVYNRTSTNEESGQKNSINSGVVGTNNGLISDTGAILQIKNALAGFVFENNGTILNSYVNGVVHNGAMYSFNGAKNNAGYISNCYTSIRQGGVIDSGSGENPIFNGTLKNVHYDRNGVETEQSNATKQTTGTMSRYDSSTINNSGFVSNLNVSIERFASDYKYNFGYPMLSGGVYAGYTYMQASTGEGTNTSPLEIPNVGKLEQIQAGKIKYVELLTNLDYSTSGITSHTQIDSVTYFEGNDYAINNIPGNAAGGFFASIASDTDTEYRDSSTDTEHLQPQKNLYTSIFTFEEENYAYLTDDYTQTTWEGNTFKSSDNTLSVEITAKKRIETPWWALWQDIEYIDYNVNIQLGDISKHISDWSERTTLKWSQTEEQYHKKNLSYSFEKVTTTGVKYRERHNIQINIILANKNAAMALFHKNGLVVCQVNYYITRSNYDVSPSQTIKNVELNYKDGAIVGDNNSTDSIGAVINSANGVTLNNVRSSGATVQGKTYVGGLVGEMKDGSMSNCFNFNDVQIQSPNTSNSSAGGLIGYANGVNLQNSQKNRIGNYGDVKIDGEGYAGGIIGHSTAGRGILYAFNIGNVQSKSMAGGLIGYLSGESLSASYMYNYGSVTTSNDSNITNAFAGGIIGYVNYSGTAKQSFNYLFNFGDVNANIKGTSTSVFVGGVVGAMNGNVEIENSGNEGSVSGIGTNWVGVGGIVGAGVIDLTKEGGSGGSKSKNSGVVSSSYNIGALYCNSTQKTTGWVGGIAGANVSSIGGCSMTGTITIDNEETFGWIMGSAWSGSSITNCYAEPSTVTVKSKGTAPTGVNEYGHNGTTDSNNPGAKFYLDYQLGLSVSYRVEKDNYGVERRKSTYSTNKYDYWKFNFTLSLKMLGNNGTTDNGNNVVYIKQTGSITDLALSYHEWINKISNNNLYGYVRVSYPQAFLTLNSGYYKIGQVKSWTWDGQQVDLSNNNLSNGLTKDNDLNSAAANSAANLRTTLNDAAHALDWTSNALTTAPDTENAEISTAEELAYISKNIDSYKSTSIKLMNDIDLTGYIWTPIGAGQEGKLLTTEDEGWAVTTNNNVTTKTAETEFGTIVYQHTMGNGGSQGYNAAIKITVNGVEILNITGVKNGLYKGEVNVNNKTWKIETFGTICKFYIDGVVTNFEGSFNGNGYTITGMAAFDESYAGLFANIHTEDSNFKEFKNVRIIKAVVQSHLWAGTIAGQVAGGSNPVLIYNNIIQSKVYSTKENGAASVVGRMGQTDSAKKGLIVGNAVNSNQTAYASSDGGFLSQGSTIPTIEIRTSIQNKVSNRTPGEIRFEEISIMSGLYEYPNISINDLIQSSSDLDISNQKAILPGIGQTYRWVNTYPYTTTAISNNIYGNSKFTEASFTRFGDVVFISGYYGENNLISYNYSSSNEPGYKYSDSGRQRWQEYTLTFDKTTYGKHNKISDFWAQGDTEKNLSYSYNGSDKSTNINRYDTNSKYFTSYYDFELLVYDGDTLIRSLKYYNEKTSYSFANDIQLYALTGGNEITGYKIINPETGLAAENVDDLSYDTLKGYIKDNVVLMQIVRAGSEITFNVGNKNEYIYTYEKDEDDKWILTDANSESTSKPIKDGLYSPDGRSGHWVDAAGTQFDLSKLEENSGSFTLYWIDDTSGDDKYNMSTYFHTITLDFNGGTAEGLPEKLYVLKNYGDDGDIVASSYTLPTTYPTKPGQDFVGWLLDGTEEKYEQGGTILVSKDIKLTAQYTAKVYNITFDANGGSGSQTEGEKETTNTSYTLPKCTFIAPIGQKFAGWIYKDASGKDVNKNVGETITLSGDITLKAKWEELEHTVDIVFPINGGDITITNRSVTIDGIGYTISVSSDAKQLIISYDYALVSDTSSSKYNTSAGEVINPNNLNAVLSAAGVKIGERDVSFDNFQEFVVLGDVCGESDPTTGFSIGSEYEEFNIPSGKIGNITLGYYGTIGGTTLGESDYFRTVNFRYNGSVVARQKFLIGYEIQSADILAEITRVGYEDYLVNQTKAAEAFNGKYKDDGTVEVAPVDNYNVTLTPIQYNVSYDGNGSTDGSLIGGTFSIEKSYAILENEFKKTGYKFVGWNTKADGSGTSFAAGDEIEYSTYNNNLTLYAQWQEIVLTLKFAPGAQGSSAIYDSITLRYEESYTLPENRYTALWYYKFAGWEYNGKTYKVGDTFGFDNSLEDDATYTFTAQWEERVLTIKFEPGSDTISEEMENVLIKTPSSSTYILPENTFTRLGFEFAGWQYSWVTQDSSGNYQTTTEISGQGTELSLDNLFAVVESGNISRVYEITLTATWSAKYTFVLNADPNADVFSGLKLDSNNPKTINLTSESLEAGYIIENPGFVVTSGDYTFAGYSLTQGGTTKDFEVGTKIDLLTFFNSDGTVKDEYESCLVGNTFTLNLYAVWASSKTP